MFACLQSSSHNIARVTFLKCLGQIVYQLSLSQSPLFHSLLYDAELEVWKLHFQDSLATGFLFNSDNGSHWQEAGKQRWGEETVFLPSRSCQTAQQQIGPVPRSHTLHARHGSHPLDGWGISHKVICLQRSKHLLSSQLSSRVLPTARSQVQLPRPFPLFFPAVGMAVASWSY